MNKYEAAQILNINENANEEEINKAFKKLAMQFHPDQNKGSEKEAETKFKEINEAKRVLLNPLEENPFEQGGIDPFQDIINAMRNPFGGFNPFAGGDPFRQQTRKIPKPINLNIKLTFKEAVEGCIKEFSFEKLCVCQNCDGKGMKASTIICSICSGSGRRMSRQGNFTFLSECGSCFGMGKANKKCSDCNGEGTTIKTSKIKVPIEGVQNGQKIKLPNCGHAHLHFNTYVNEDIFISVSVENHPFFKIEDRNVISNLEINLLQALEGATIKIDTVREKIDLKISPLIKNGDQIRVKNQGVKVKNQTGDHIFTINIKYPKNVDKLIKVLKEEN